MAKSSSCADDFEFADVGKRIQESRKKQGLTREQLSEKSGLAVQSLEQDRGRSPVLKNNMIILSQKCYVNSFCPALFSLLLMHSRQSLLFKV